MVWKGTNGNNFWVGRDGETAVAIVDHCMSKGADGTRATLPSCWGWFSNPKSEVSAHFGISKAGEVWQFVKLSDTAWGNGILENPDLSLPWLAECVKKKINPNKRTISIEHEGDSFDKMPEAQYQASLALHRYLIATVGTIKADRQHIIGHYQITGRNRALCPGPGFPWERLMNDLKYSPNPDQHAIGPGVLQKLIEHSDQAASDEIYFTVNRPELQPHQVSHTETKAGHVIVAAQYLEPAGERWETRYL
jgi:N-acetylmuramoyl-L-alanine amidase